MLGSPDADWQRQIAEALRTVRRPIAAPERFLPRRAGAETRLDLPARAAFPAARLASALLLVYPDDAGNPTIPLTKRHPDLRAHAGEVSLPGGASDATDASREATALREAHEEIGLDPGAVDLAGTLDDVWIPVSNFEVRPFVGTMRHRPELRPAAEEVSAILELPVAALLTDDVVEEEEIAVRGGLLRAAVYRFSGERIWGATARVLSMFVTVLEEADLVPMGGR